MIDPAITARESVLDSRIADLRGREAGLLEMLERIRGDLGAARDERQRIEAAKQPARPGGRPMVAEETWARVAREMGMFTSAEYATEIGCRPAMAKRHIDALVADDVIRPAGRVLGKAVYESVSRIVEEPVEPIAPARHLEIVPEPEPEIGVDLPAPDAPERGEAVAGVSKRHGDHALLRRIGDKDARQEAQKALKRGWTLKEKRGGGVVLANGPRRSPTTSADVIRRVTRDRHTG